MVQYRRLLEPRGVSVPVSWWQDTQKSHPRRSNTPNYGDSDPIDRHNAQRMRNGRAELP
jgi:hypothetical protein